MKTLTIYALAFFACFSTMSQTYAAPAASENDSLYIKAVQNYISQYELNPNKYIAPNQSPRVLYISGEDFLNLPETVDGYKLVQLWPSNQNEYLKENKGRLLTISFLPLTVEDGKFYIDIKQFEIKSKSKTEIEPVRIGMWVTTYFKFENGRMIYERFTVGGTY